MVNIMNKRRTRLGVLGLLFIAPSLMAAAVRDDEYTAFTSNYRDISVNVTPISVSVEGDKTEYEFKIKNNGEGYVSPNFIYYTTYSSNYDSNGENNNLEISIKNNDRVFREIEFIKPNDEFTFSTLLNTQPDDFDGGYFYMSAVIDPDNSITFSGTLGVTKDPKQKNFYRIDTAPIGKVKGYSYSYVVSLTYDGKEYALNCNTDVNGDLYFCARSDTDTIDLSKLTIRKIEAFSYKKKEERGINYGGFVMGAINLAIIIILAVHLSVFFFVVLPLIIISKAIKRNKMAKNKK